MLELKGEENHGFDQIIMQLARKMFNMFAKIYSKEIKSELHRKAPTKGSIKSISQSSSKVNKLQSGSK